MMSALPRLAALALLVMLAACGGGQSDNRMNLRSPGASQAALHPNETPELRALIDRADAEAARAKAERAIRLAAALRANLRRRKAPARTPAAPRDSN